MKKQNHLELVLHLQNFRAKNHEILTGKILSPIGGKQAKMKKKMNLRRFDGKTKSS